MFSLKTIKSLENALQPHSGVTPLFSMRTVSLASSQSCRSVDADAWYKRGLKDEKETAHCKRVLLVCERLNTTVNDFGSKNILVLPGTE